jgi:hypothetical protein
MLKTLKSLAKSFPGIRRLVSELNELTSTNARLRADLSKWRHGFVAPGHYYSPVVNIDEIRKIEDRIFKTGLPPLEGIDLHEARQNELLDAFISYYAALPFPEDPSKDFRYHLNNNFYAYSDGICLYSMLRHMKPKRFIEVGSGYSSAAALDTNELFFEGEIEFTFIEPYPERLESLLKAEDLESPKNRLIKSFVQEVPVSTFQSLEAGDILFIDSTHVSKTGSDVNYLLFDVLPSLNAGVHVHFHDVFYPFEYPSAWVYDGRSWNEAYMLRAFLQYNSAFRVSYFNSYMEQLHHEKIRHHMPLCIKKPHNELTMPGSIWIQRCPGESAIR